MSEHSILYTSSKAENFESLLKDDESLDLQKAANGPELLAKLKDALPDLVILDHEDDLMDLVDICRNIRRVEGGQAVPILVLSSKVDRKTIRASIRAGADDIMLKPVRDEEFWAKIDTLFEKGRANGNARSSSATQEMRVLKEGMLFNERYEIIHQFGEGGFSQLYQCHDLMNDGKRVALKIFNFSSAQRKDEKFVSRFLREAYAHSKLDHKNIVRFLDVGQSFGTFFIVMELIYGNNLEQMLEEFGTFNEEQLIVIAYEIISALIYMEENDLIHRDIKPNNIMIDTDGNVTLVDFGLTRKPGDDLTHALDFNCTPQFASPEIIENTGPIDIRSDIYSLAVTLYLLATNEFPITGETPMIIIQNHLLKAPRPLTEISDEISPFFSDLIFRMMAKSADDRPSLSEIKRTLKEHMHRNQEA